MNQRLKILLHFENCEGQTEKSNVILINYQQMESDIEVRQKVHFSDGKTYQLDMVNYFLLSIESNLSEEMSNQKSRQASLSKKKSLLQEKLIKI